MSYVTMCTNDTCPSRKLCERYTKTPSEYQSWSYFEFQDGQMCEHYVNMEGKNCTPQQTRSKIVSDISKSGTEKSYIEWLEDFYIKNHQRR